MALFRKSPLSHSTFVCFQEQPVISLSGAKENKSLLCPEGGGRGRCEVENTS